MADPASDSDAPTSSAVPPHDPYSALRVRDFRWFLAGSLPYTIGINMQTVAVSWEIYERTNSNLALALVGLMQIIPVVTLFLPAGHLIDRVDRKKILLSVLPAA